MLAAATAFNSATAETIEGAAALPFSLVSQTPLLSDLYQGKESFRGSFTPPETIVSNVPVTVSKIVVSSFSVDGAAASDNFLMDANFPVGQDEFYIVVRKNSACNGDDEVTSSDVSINMDEEGRNLVVFVDNLPLGEDGNNKTEFLPPAQYQASWDCTPGSTGETSGGGWTNGGKSNGIMLATLVAVISTLTFMASGNPFSNRNRDTGIFTAMMVCAALGVTVLASSATALDTGDIAPMNSNPQYQYTARNLETEDGATAETCLVDVEIIYRSDCLFNEIKIEAPSSRYLEMNEVLQFENDEVTSTCEASMTSNPPEGGWNPFNAATGILFDPCPIDGRPFRDAEGRSRMAETVEKARGATSATKTPSPQSWSLPRPVNSGWTTQKTPPKRLVKESGIVDEARLSLKHQPRRELQTELGLEWKRRAAGEHASIASFAAFTIALMTNEAPPSLIEQSLVAAQDELRHAKTSYEMASDLLDTILEPGPLPPSQHMFSQDLTTLALGVAREGCIDETLSALALVESIESLEREEIFSDECGGAFLQDHKEKTLEIAREEAEHAVLAWKTIGWICNIDPDGACLSVRENVLNGENLSRAFAARFTSGRTTTTMTHLDKAWEYISKTLIPLVTNRDSTSNGTSSCSASSETSLLGHLMGKYSETIVNGVKSTLLEVARA